MKVYLIDGTYELFRYYYALPSVREGGVEVAALRGVVGSVLGLINSGVTHLAVATDHVIESFRNRLWRGYKTSAGIEPELLAQFHPLEDALRSLGVVVWPMVEFEADDALASGAALAERDARVERVVICTPDKDLGQSVRGTRVVQLDRRRNLTRDEAGVVSKFGVAPASIPDYLALVGDAADGYPGLKGWGPKSSAAVLVQVRSPRGDSRRLADVEGECRERRYACGYAGPRSRAGDAVSRPGDAPVRHRALRVG